MSEPTANTLPTAAPLAADAPVAPPPLPVAELLPADFELVADEPLSSDRPILAFLKRAAQRIDDWFCGDGRWYLGSAAVHAIAILCLGLIVSSPPREVRQDEAASFDAAEADAATPKIDRYELGDAPLDPSELDTDTLALTKALPVAREARHYDDSEEFEEAGGGTPTTRTGPQLGGMGGLMIPGLPGPAGHGGVGVGAGFGTHAGWGGAGEGFGNRGKGNREALLGATGGTRASERAVGAALNWLARHQNPAGHWSLDFRRQCRSSTCSGASSIRSDSAATAMALLPFLAAGQTHKSKGPYQQTISKGLTWLITRQNSDGDLSARGQQQMYSHGLATIAICEAYGITKDEHIGYAAEKAVQFIEAAQNDACGGWRYHPQEFGDTSVFGWQIMALKSAQLAGVPISTMVFEKAKKWLDSVAAGHYGGLYRYQPATPEVTPTMTAVGMLCRQYMGLDAKDPGMLEGKTCLLENPPSTSLTRNCYYWYYATLAMHNFADADWDAWNRKMRRVLIESQDREGCAEGSWDPDKPSGDRYGQQGGRLMMTSFNALTLEVYYRYLPLFKTDSPAPEPGAAAIDSAKPDGTKTEE